MELIKKYAVQFESFLKANPFAKDPQNLYEPADYILSLGGKRLRPVFALLGCDLFSGNPDTALKAAMAVEVFHNFTLLHDDIMDESEIRRGQPTVHMRYNHSAAILSGDMMMIKAYQYILDYQKPELVTSLLYTFNKMALEVCEGQQLDMDFEASKNVRISDYLEMITLKTSVLLAASIQMGAQIGGADELNQRHIFAFAKNFGLSFQLQDDYLDAFGDESQVGKLIGGDIIRNKKTYLYLKALELADENQKSTLHALYSSENTTSPDEKISIVKKIYKDLLVSEYSNQLIEAYRDLSVSHLNACDISEEMKLMITNMINELIFRKN